MTECVILYRINGGKVGFVHDASANESEVQIAVFSNMDIAVDYALNNALFASGQADYQIVELDEL